MKKLFCPFLVILQVLALSACVGGGGGSAVPDAKKPLAPGIFTRSVDLGTTPASNAYPFSHTSRGQYLYTASEVGAAGRLTGLRFRLGDALASPATCANLTVMLGHTNLAGLSVPYSSNLDTGQGSAVTVLDSGTITIPAGDAGTWFDISFQTPFDYNGVDNLVVDITAGSVCSPAVTVQTQTTAAPDSRLFMNLVDGERNMAQFIFTGGDALVRAADRTGGLILPVAMAPGSTGRTQFLLRATDIAGSGPVTGLQFRIPSGLTTAATATYSVTLSLVDAATTSLGSANFADNFGSHAVLVAQDVCVNLPVGTTEWWVPFSGSFTYDGTGNLLVDVTATVVNGFKMVYQNTPTTRVLWSADPSAATGYLGPHALEPRLRFNGGQTLIMPPVPTGFTNLPLGGPASGGQLQSLYRNDLIGTSGRITAVFLRLAAPSTAVALANYKLYMGHTTKTGYSVTDTYASNMDENALVFKGTLNVPAGLRAGDWVRIPLVFPFVYDSAKNLSVLFTTDHGDTGNNVSTRTDADQFASNVVGRLDNSVDSSGTPQAVDDAVMDLKIELQK
jgi:hypothetical protein